METKVFASIKDSKRTYKRIGSEENPLRVRIKKLAANAVIPTYAHGTDAGMDLYATSKTFDDHGNMVIGTGIAVEIPRGYVGLVFPRSSVSNHYCYMANSVGVIDSGYRGEITCKFAPRTTMVFADNLWKRIVVFLKGKCPNDGISVNSSNIWHSREQYQIGDRVAQLIILPYPKVSFIESDELTSTDRGTGGYGSTGK